MHIYIKHQVVESNFIDTLIYIVIVTKIYTRKDKHVYYPHVLDAYIYILCTQKMGYVPIHIQP